MNTSNTIRSKKQASSGLTRRETLKYGLYGGLAAATPAALWLAGCGSQQHGKKPNIFLISVDTLRADHLNCYGYSKNTSPNIDSFASESLLFENCFSHASTTSSSCASIISGFLPHETTVYENLPVPPNVETISEILEPHGYKNLAVVSNYVLRSVRGWAPGFVIYDDTMNQQELIRSTIPERIAIYTTDRAIELIEQFRNDRLFMWVHYQDPHGPFTPPEKFAEMFLDTHQKPRILKVNDTKTGRGGIPHYQRLGDNRDFNFYVSQYDGEIRYMDEHFGRLIDTLRRLDLYDDSIIIFTSDHGEGMGEHDYYFNHGEYLYSDQIHVPLIIKYGKQLSGRRTDFVQHLDLIPTILSMLGIKPDERFRGRDLRKAKKESKEIFAEMRDSKVRDGVKFSLIVDPFKLIYTPIDKQYELFDLREDYYEEHDLISDANYKKQAEDLKVRLHRIHEDDRLQLEIFNIPPKLTDEEIRKLRSLGYLD